MTKVLVNGCFDVFHYGHLQLLKFAKTQGDYLIVAINSDDSYTKLKNEQPLNSEDIRQETLEALKCVDEVIVFDNPNISGIMKFLGCDIWVKGSDYSLETINQHELIAAKELGYKIVFFPVVNKQKYSSSKFKNAQNLS